MLGTWKGEQSECKENFTVVLYFKFITMDQGLFSFFLLFENWSWLLTNQQCCLYSGTGVSSGSVPAWTTAACLWEGFPKPRRGRKFYQRWRKSQTESWMSLSTLVRLIKPKTGALLLWNMKAIGQQPWPGENCCQVSTDGEGMASHQGTLKWDWSLQKTQVPKEHYWVFSFQLLKQSPIHHGCLMESPWLWRAAWAIHCKPWCSTMLIIRALYLGAWIYEKYS